MMKRTAAACAAALAMIAGGAQAQSSVQISGTADLFLGGMKAAGDASRRTAIDNGGMTTSWFGFRGTEDLGGGLKAGFALSSFFRADSGAVTRYDGDPFFSREANVSLSGGFGTLTVGRALAPNFLPTVLFNPFADSFTFSPVVLHNNMGLFNGTGWTASTPSDTGWSNQLMYTSPSLAGLTVNLNYQFGEQPNDNGKKNVGLNVLYFNGPFAATAFYERAQISNPVTLAPYAGGDTKKDWMVGASWDFGVAKLFGTYGEAKADVSGAESDTWSLGVSVPLGAGKLLVGTARTDKEPGPTRRTSTVGYDYNLSKNTDVYAMLMRDSITGYESGTSWGVGIRKRF